MRLQLSLEASDLQNTRGFFKRSNPFAKASLTNTRDVIGHTETIHASLSPKWASGIVLPNFDPNSDLFISVIIYDDYAGKKDDIDMGEVLVNVNEVYRSSQDGIEFKTSLETGVGSLHLWAQESFEPSSFITLKFRALDVENIEMGRLGLGHTDPFFEIYKKHVAPSNDTSRWQLVYRSEFIKNHLNPLWKEFEMSLEDFCDGDTDKDIKIQIWDWQKKGLHRLLGQVETSTEVIQKSIVEKGNGDRTNALTCVSSLFHNAKSVGDLIVLKAQISQL